MNNLKKRRASWIDFAFTITILSLIIAGVFLTFFNTKNEAASLSPNEKQGTSTTIDSNYPGIKISTETSNDSFAPYAIQYPQSLHDPFNEEVSTYIHKIKEDYIHNMKEYKEAGGKLNGELNISFKTLLHHSGNYSFVLVTDNYTGGANGTTEIRAFHLNPDTGKGITIHNIFGDDVTKLDHLAMLVRKALYEDAEIASFLFPEEVELHTKPLWENYHNFALTNESMIFYFDEYQFSAGAAGAPIVTIPLEKLTKIIVDPFKVKITEKSTTPENKQPETEVAPGKPADKTDNTPPLADTNIKKVALTFDDGPHPKVTRQILEILKKYDAKATFFMLGSRVEYYPDIAKEVKEAGHELGNHSWNHPDLRKADIEKIGNEINNTSAIIEQATGQKATVFRPPYGAFNDTVRAQTDLPIILWDVDTLDWKHRTASKLLPIVKASVKDGSNILMHDIHQSTADGLDSILAYLQGEGYTFVTVSELE